MKLFSTIYEVCKKCPELYVLYKEQKYHNKRNSWECVLQSIGIPAMSTASPIRETLWEFIWEKQIHIKGTEAQKTL